MDFYGQRVSERRAKEVLHLVSILSYNLTTLSPDLGFSESEF